WLEGREEAYISHTTFTPHGKMKEEKREKAVFARRLLAPFPAEPAGTREFHLPQDVMPSFESARAAIVWRLRVEVLGDGQSSLHEHKTSFHEHKILIRTPLPAT